MPVIMVFGPHFLIVLLRLRPCRGCWQNGLGQPCSPPLLTRSKLDVGEWSLPTGLIHPTTLQMQLRSKQTKRSKSKFGAHLKIGFGSTTVGRRRNRTFF